MSDCIFCKIAKGEIPSVKIWEDDEFFAILDLFPNTKGMTLVIPKSHYDSDVFEMDDEIYQRFLLAVKKVVRVLEKGLKVYLDNGADNEKEKEKKHFEKELRGRMYM